MVPNVVCPFGPNGTTWSYAMLTGVEEAVFAEPSAGVLVLIAAKVVSVAAPVGSETVPLMLAMFPMVFVPDGIGFSNITTPVL